MKRRVLAIILIIVVVTSLSACGGSNVKTKLCDGVWVKKYKGVVFYGDWWTTDIYEFSTNGSFTRYCYEYWELSGKLNEDIYTGKYRIDSTNKEIVLTYNKSDDEVYAQGEKYHMPYYINEYNHELVIESDSTGYSNYSNYSSKDNISFVW